MTRDLRILKEQVMEERDGGATTDDGNDEKQAD